MKQNSNLERWADAHVFYNLYSRKPNDNDSTSVRQELTWREKMLNETPNGKLITNNTFFKDVKSKKKIYLAHITSNLKIIEKTKTIYPSGGCLAGSIYCAPLVKHKGKLRLHNLGKYIFEKEASLISKKKNIKPNLLIFEIQLDKNDSINNLPGIDYLRLGDIQLELYRDLEYLLSPKERFDLYQIILSKIRKSIKYLILCNDYNLSPEKVAAKEFFHLLTEAIGILPILGYFYFEVISEYIMLHQDNDLAKKHAEIGEFYNPSYKIMMYSLHPKLKENGKLNSFAPDLENLVSYLSESGLFEKFSRAHFERYAIDRLIYLTNSRLFDLDKNIIDWYRFEWNFKNLVLNAGKLAGHLLHRELRNFGRYPSFYFYFDQTKALQAWNYWNHMDVRIPFNGVFPKGEAGINPAYPDLNYKVHLGKVSVGNGFSYVEPVKKLDLIIEPHLVDLKFTQMRINAMPIKL